MTTIMGYYSLKGNIKVNHLSKEMKHYKKQLMRWAKAIGADRLDIVFYYNEYVGCYAQGWVYFDASNSVTSWSVGKYSKGHYKFKDASKCYAD